MGYLPGESFTKFLNINNGGSRKGVNPFSVVFTLPVKATVKRRRSAPVVLILTVCTPFSSVVDDQGISKYQSNTEFHPCLQGLKLH